MRRTSLFLQLDNMLWHHFKLAIVALWNELLVGLGLIHFLTECLLAILEISLQLNYFIFPFIFFLDYLQASTLTKSIDRMQLLCKLDQLAEVRLLKEGHLLSLRRIWIDKSVELQQWSIIRVLLHKFGFLCCISWVVCHLNRKLGLLIFRRHCILRQFIISRTIIHIQFDDLFYIEELGLVLRYLLLQMNGIASRASEYFLLRVFIRKDVI